MAARWRAERLFRFFEFLDECSETRGGVARASYGP
jgi:hypothetical protein